ncbi:MAG TPA: CopG family antitoxin [Candidatus Kapabacteria bacterium]|jgi:hypothetical protein
MKRLKEIPEFKNEEQEADFWASHDTADYFDLSELREVSFPNLKRSNGLIPVILDDRSEQELRELANERSLDIPVLAAQYVGEGIQRDAHAHH